MRLLLYIASVSLDVAVYRQSETHHTGIYIYYLQTCTAGKEGIPKREYHRAHTTFPYSKPVSHRQHCWDRDMEGEYRPNHLYLVWIYTTA